MVPAEGHEPAGTEAMKLNGRKEASRGGDVLWLAGAVLSPGPVATPVVVVASDVATTVTLSGADVATGKLTLSGADVATGKLKGMPRVSSGVAEAIGTAAWVAQPEVPGATRLLDSSVADAGAGRLPP